MGTHMTDDNILPLEIARWANEAWVKDCLSQGGLKPSDVMDLDPNRPITSIGSTLLHLTAICPHRPSKEVSRIAMRFFLEQRGADPNTADEYGRTPLVSFLLSPISWYDDPSYGVDGLQLLFRHGADANVLFTPDFVGIAECEHWRLVHHCIYAAALWGARTVPPEMMKLLSQHWNAALPDGRGRRLPDYQSISR